MLILNIALAVGGAWGNIVSPLRPTPYVFASVSLFCGKHCLPITVIYCQRGICEKLLARSGTEGAFSPKDLPHDHPVPTTCLPTSWEGNFLIWHRKAMPFVNFWILLQLLNTIKVLTRLHSDKNVIRKLCVVLSLVYLALFYAISIKKLRNTHSIRSEMVYWGNTVMNAYG